MSKVAIVTDSNSGIRQAEVKGTNIYVLPMPFIINSDEYLEDINLSQEQFYKMLASGAEVSTSQPSIYEVQKLWDKLLKEYDQIVHIPMSSGLSASCASAQALSEQYAGKVFVIDNHRISVTQKISVYEAQKLANEGKTAEEIAKYLLDTAHDSSIYITVATLKYLKKGGRVTPAAAMIGTLLSVKPVLQIQGEKLDAYTKVLSNNTAKVKMINALKRDFETRFKDIVQAGEMRVAVAHTQNTTMAEDLKKALAKQFPNVQFETIDPLSLSVSCHIGPGSFAVACARCNYNKH